MSFFFRRLSFCLCSAWASSALYLRRNRRRLLEVSSTFSGGASSTANPTGVLSAGCGSRFLCCCSCSSLRFCSLRLARPANLIDCRGSAAPSSSIDTRARTQAGSAFPQALRLPANSLHRLRLVTRWSSSHWAAKPWCWLAFTSRSKELWDRFGDRSSRADGGGEAGPVLALAEKLLPAAPEPPARA